MRIPGYFKSLLKHKTVRAILTVFIIVVLALYFRSNSSTEADLTVNSEPVVKLTTAQKYAGNNSISLIGNVRAFNEAIITSEKSGRVTSVNATLGKEVTAGTMLVTLENAAEQASVLQAEGIYDAAVAAAAQSGVGVDEAKNSLKRAQDAAVSAFKSAYNTTNGVVINSIDQFFADPNSRTPGLRIDGKGYTSDLNTERVAYQTLLPTWQERVNTITTESDLETEIKYANENVQRTINLIDAFLVVFDRQSNSARYTDSEILTFTNTFTGLRSTLFSVQSSLDTSLTGLSSAEDGLRRAELAAQGGTTSAADAQVKQALGALRAAQANLSKTILRTPISGTVNTLSVRTGDFINSFAEVAVIANNNALEIVTYLSETEKDMLAVGDEVTIEGKFTGIVTQISPAVDNSTRKIEVRIAAENIDVVNGDTVRITKTISEKTNGSDIVTVPLSAVKFETNNGSVFVVEDGKLSSKPVVLGTVRGGSVEIVEGLLKNEEFVIDARGLLSGETVTVIE